MTQIIISDVSSWQGNISLASAAIDGIIAKATEGNYYTNPYLDQQIGQARATNKGAGYYHYYAGNDPAQEARHFWDVVGSRIRQGEVIALDFEIAVNDPDGVCSAFFDTINQLAGFPAGQYMNSSTKNSLQWTKVRAHNTWLWVAQYGSNSGNPESQPTAAPWANITGWQYTSNGTVNGIGGRVDMSIFYCDLATFKKLGKPDGQPAPTTPVAPIEPTAPKSTPATYVIKSGDTFWGLEEGNNWAHGTLQALNPGVKPRELALGQAIIVPAAAGTSNGTSGGVYIIQPNDNLTKIAAKFGTTIDALVAANRIPNPNLIPAGGSLVIPGVAAPASDPNSYTVNSPVPGYTNASDAVNGVNSNSTVPAGTYSVFNRANGAINITRQAGVPGWWIKA